MPPFRMFITPFGGKESANYGHLGKDSWSVGASVPAANRPRGLLRGSARCDSGARGGGDGRPSQIFHFRHGVIEKYQSHLPGRSQESCFSNRGLKI